MIGEIIISLVALTGGGYIFATTINEGVRLAISGMLSIVLVFWFQRRATEQASNAVVKSSEQATAAVTTLANGQLSSLQGAIDQLNQKVERTQSTLDRAKIT